MAMEREQAERDQQRSLGVDDWDTTIGNSQLGDEIPVQAYSNLGSLLNSQSLGRELRFTTENFSQTAAVATSSASTLTAPPPPPPPPPVPPATSNRRIMLGLLAAIVAVLFGTSTYCMHLRGKNRAWEAENSMLRAQITKLENARTSAGGSLDTFTTPTSCPGSQLIDTCWFKVGWGECTKDVLEDPVKPLEDAVRLAWDSTAEVIGAVTDTVASDLRQVCDAMKSFGSFIFEL